MRMCKKGQGATEYLLMLAAVLVIVAIAVYYVTSAAPSATITGTAVLQTDNDITFTPSTTMVPSSISTADWEWAVYRDATQVTGFTSATATLERGVPVELDTNAQVGDIVKIRYKGTTVYDAAPVQSG